MFDLQKTASYTGFNRHIFKLVTGKNLKILDIGCGEGELGRILKHKGNVVYGIECEKRGYELSKKKLDKVLFGDISSLQLPKDWKEFDYVIFADVIEHLYDPASVLKKIKPLLKKGGFVLISTPNIANWLIRTRLLFGRFDYKESGVMDKTHIRWFTLRSLKKLVKETGYKVEKIDFIPNIVLSIISIFSKNKAGESIVSKESGAKSFYFKIIYPVEKFISRINPRFFGYEFVIKIRK
ncbi:class I SAM-dependent methyltransferase [Candidatus Woesearchaeota archaeon]|nr:class I SAM-dependent methyltransferase [Candidatus Woesearchaeota archaeon]